MIALITHTAGRRLPAPLRRLATPLRKLSEDIAGNSITEFALILPILITLGMYGMETAYMATINMQVSQIAQSVADNGSRMEQTSNSGVSPTVTETDINSVMTGATLQGANINLSTRGKVFLSSLEVKPSTSPAQQYIHWQRCTGSYSANSSYGVEGTVVTNMGNGVTKITAPSGTAVMFAEVHYQYRGLFGSLFVQPMVFRQEAAVMMRDDRNLTAGLTGTKTAVC
ncbi:MAG: hypothetical protein RLY97_761 [Pseudomonadota bacterium]|jgi:Flp pilus assembly protein TadG